MSKKKSLLLKIQRYHFMMVEVGLFLNTHCDCEDALAAFEKYRNCYLGAKSEYEKLYGPISYDGVKTKCDRWSWVEGPWPWEGEC